MYRIGVKYCGGCMPEYDRSALVEKIRTRLAKRAELVPWNLPDTDIILVVSGCPNACADIEAFSRMPLFFLDSPADAEPLIKIIESEHLDELAELLPRNDHNGPIGRQGN